MSYFERKANVKARRPSLFIFSTSPNPLNQFWRKLWGSKSESDSLSNLERNCREDHSQYFLFENLRIHRFGEWYCNFIWLVDKDLHVWLNLLKADMKRYIPLETAAIFFLANLFLKGIGSEYVMVDFICMGKLGLQGAKTENYKILAHSRTRTHDPWFSSLVPYQLGHQVWYTNDNLKLIQ